MMNISFLAQSAAWTRLSPLFQKPAPHNVEPMSIGAAVTHESSHLAHQPVHAQAARPLRVVRLLEDGQAPSQVGRMVISGRMADVCAELDRLVAREAALH